LPISLCSATLFRFANLMKGSRKGEGEMMKLPIYQVDAFTQQLFKGNSHRPRTKGTESLLEG
jgi:hypothetical protein